jgi:methylenetetrahydrofolate reductase (NADPH)
MGKTLNEIVASNEFMHGIELVTTRGTLQVEGEKTNRFAHELMESNIFDFISITDNPGGHPMMAPESLGKLLMSKGHNVNIHISCKDRNRNALETRAWQLASDGFTNILALTGDYPTSGQHGLPRSSFDIDAVGLIHTYSEMNEGLLVPSHKKDTPPTRLSKTEFLLSAAVSPFKKHEAEYLPQYFKMEKKLRAGAHFFILQLGYDSRKWAELLMYCKEKQITAPMMANIYMLTKGVAKVFHDERIAGCVVSPTLLQTINKAAESPDKGKSFFLEFAAKQWAIAKGLGFRGAYLGGTHKLEDLQKIEEKVKSFSADDWKIFYSEISYPAKDEFYLYKTDANNLPTAEYVDAYVQSKKTLNRCSRIVFCEAPVYKLSQLVHLMLFNKASPLYHLMKGFYKLIVGKTFVEKCFHALEHTSKFMLYGCQDCGDCSLAEIAYLCPQDKCSKGQRNGPCGGSHGGTCEVLDRPCIWLKAYKRLKPHGQERLPYELPTVFVDAKLLRTSAWQNFYLNRDHTRNNV